MKLVRFNSNEEIQTFIDYLFEQCPILPEDEACVKSFKDIWIRFLSHHSLNAELNLGNQFLNQCYPLEHNIPSYEIVITFVIPNIIELLSEGFLSGQEFLYSQLKENMHFSNTGDMDITQFSFSTPILSVFMPNCTDGKWRCCEAIDGNHRLSAATYSGIDVPVTNICDLVLPTKAFINESSWFLYHILTGYYIVVSHIQGFPPREQYLEALTEFLQELS